MEVVPEQFGLLHTEKSIPNNNNKRCKEMQLTGTKYLKNETFALYMKIGVSA